MSYDFSSGGGGSSQCGGDQTESKNTVVDYLSSHIGETPTQKEMAEQTGIGLTRLRAILAELKDAGLLVMENRVIVSIDVDMAKEDIEVQVS